MPFALGAQDPEIKYAAFIQAVAIILRWAPSRVLSEALRADPTWNHLSGVYKGQYVGWILKQMKFGNIILPEDGDRVREALATLEEAKRVRYGGVEFDINRYKTIGDLETVTDQIIDATSGRQRERPREIEELPEGATLYAESEHYKIIKVTGLDACIYLGRGTKWCTRQSDVAKEYLEQYGELYVILALDGDQWVVYGQYTPDYGQIMDTKNEPLNIDDPELVDLMKPDLGAPDAAKRAYNYVSNVLRRRWLEGEHAISQNPLAAFNYAYKVIEGRWPEAEPVIAQHPEGAFNYASRVIRGRWPEGEAAIAQSPQWAYPYAHNMIRGRWPEGEPAIAWDPRLAYDYAHNVLHGRFPEGEAAFAQNPWLAYEYALNVIYGRFPEAEPAIAQDPKLAYYYARNVIRGRWPEGEHLIAQSPGWACQYARDVIRGRWPEGEAAIARDTVWAYEYYHFLKSL